MSCPHKGTPFMSDLKITSTTQRSEVTLTLLGLDVNRSSCQWLALLSHTALQVGNDLAACKLKGQCEKYWNSMEESSIYCNVGKCAFAAHLKTK